MTSRPHDAGRGPTDGDPHGQLVLHRARVDGDVVQCGTVPPRPGNPFGGLRDRGQHHRWGRDGEVGAVVLPDAEHVRTGLIREPGEVDELSQSGRRVQGPAGCRVGVISPKVNRPISKGRAAVMGRPVGARSCRPPSL